MIHFFITLDAGCWPVAPCLESILCLTESVIFKSISDIIALRARASPTKHTVKLLKQWGGGVQPILLLWAPLFNMHANKLTISIIYNTFSPLKTLRGAQCGENINKRLGDLAFYYYSQTFKGFCPLWWDVKWFMFICCARSGWWHRLTGIAEKPLERPALIITLTTPYVRGAAALWEDTCKVKEELGRRV